MLKGSASPEAGGPGTTVGVNVALSGTLKDQNDIVIHGMVDGEVISEKSVNIGKTAQVKGPIRGHTVTVAGIVRGSIDASDKLEIVETGKVFGSISTKDLVIHSGAVLIGKSTMPAEEQIEEPADSNDEASGSTESGPKEKDAAVVEPDEE